MKNVAIIKYNKDTKKTLVYTSNCDVIEYSCKPLQLIEKWCIMNGSTLEGRIQAFKCLMNLNRKCPIYITDQVLLMVTCAKDNEECVFINYHNLFQIRAKDMQSTVIRFMGGFCMTVDFNSRIIAKQIKRAKAYMNLIYDNKKELYKDL